MFQRGLREVLVDSHRQPANRCYFHREDTVQLPEQSSISAAASVGVKLPNNDFHAGNPTLTSEQRAFGEKYSI